LSFSKYAAIVAATVTTSMLVAWPLLRASGEPRAAGAAIMGALLAAANALVAYALVLWSAGRSHVAFMRAILGGMLARMALLLAAVVIAVLGLGLPRLPLVFSLLGHFVAFLGLELFALQSRPQTAGASR
jgi:hypothetical protein